MFFSFTNFHRRFIRNFNRIRVLLISKLQTTGNNELCIQASRNEKNHNVPGGICGDASSNNVCKSFKNLSIINKSAKSKKLGQAKSKKEFAKVDSTTTDFVIPKVKKTFIHL